MTQQQINTIDKVISETQNDPSVIGVILVGSLAKGTERDTSDVDVFIVVNDELFLTYSRKHQLYWTLPITDKTKFCDVDGKIISKSLLTKALNNGTESIKSTFHYSKLLYSIDPEVDKLVEALKNTNIIKNDYTKLFYALMKSKRYTADDDINNLMQLKSCILDTVLYACRLVLAHNNKPYPCMKNIEKEIINCSDKPINFMHNMHILLQTFSLEALEVFYNEVEDHFNMYRFDDTIRKSYVIENELFWYFDEKPLEYV